MHPSLPSLTFSVSLLCFITQAVFFMPFNHLLSPSLCRGGTQWVGASSLERCEVASSPFPLISEPCFCKLRWCYLWISSSNPAAVQPAGLQINKAVSLRALIPPYSASCSFIATLWCRGYRQCRLRLWYPLLNGGWIVLVWLKPLWALFPVCVFD